jgi:protein SCO1
MRRNFLSAGGATIAAALIGGTWAIEPEPAQAAEVRLPNPEVIDQFGHHHQFYDDLIRGRAVLLNFFFTSCGDTCPLVTQNLREVQDILGDRMGRDIFMVSVTLQPELETPAILRDYAALWNVRPGWSFVTGRPDDIELLRRATGFADVSPEYAVVRDSHTGLVRYGNDRLQRWAGTTALGRPAWIAKTVARIADMG